jgi:sulfatase modifying factor 1
MRRHCGISLGLFFLGACFDPSDVDEDTEATAGTMADPSTTGGPGATSSAMDDDGEPTGGAVTSSGSGDDVSDASETAEPLDTTAAVDGSTTMGEPACDDRDNACPADEYCVSGTCMTPPEDMVAVPGGAFSMGCNEALDADCAPDEYPYHEVNLGPFAIDRTEVTLTAYQSCIDAGECPPLPAMDASGNPCANAPGDLPVSCVSWFHARDYCESVGKRLPTEAEWEKAARSDDGRIYPWGAEAPSCTLAVMSDCPTNGKQPVATKPAGASPYGALDMSGNVFEWVADWYGAAYYVESPPDDPQGPDNGARRIIRSGGSNYGAAAMRNSFRGVSFEVPTPDSTHTNVGFRCALTP